jgi:hypothetical protein
MLTFDRQTLSTRAAVAILVAALWAGLAVGLAPPVGASSDHNQVVNITFPVLGPNSYINDYTYARSGGAHRATDIMASYGQQVHAAVGGRITWMPGATDNRPPSYGYMITIRGDDGRSYNYIHLGRQDGPASEAYAPGLAVNSRVERGQHIGWVGHSGNAHPSAPHLHFEIRDPNVTDPYGSDRINPYFSLRAAEARGDLPRPPSGFVDVLAHHTFANDIRWIAERRITRGCNPPHNTRYCPGMSVTREQMAAFLARALGLTDDRHPGFTDVRADSTFDRDIRRLARAGITKGCNPPANDRFCPSDPVTREQMAAFMVRALDLTDDRHRGFSDVPAGSKFDRDIRRLARADVTRGCNPPDNTRYCPKDPVSRAQMAAFLRRALN